MERRSKAFRALVLASVTVVSVLGWGAAGLLSAGQAWAAPGFSDIGGQEWYAEAALALEAEGIISPRADGSFGPHEPVTRGEMVVYLDRVLKLQASTAHPFTDVGPYDWYAGAVGDLYAAGLVSGTTATTFSPGTLVNRQQAASLIMRSLEYYLAGEAPVAGQTPPVDYSLAEAEAGAWLAGFGDRLLIAGAHAQRVANAYRLGVVQGDANGWFYPALPVSRSQVAAMLYRAFKQPLAVKPAPPTEVEASVAYPEQSAGSEGTLVYLLESRLADLHYPCGTVDNIYDKCTRDAVMAFEKVEKLPRDGVAGAEVWGRIFATKTPAPRLPAAGNRVEVDLTRQVLFMISGDVVTEVVHVSTGKLGTPTGHGDVWLRQEGWQECSVGWMYYPAYFLPRIAIHGSSSVPPYPASHGCVRLPTWITPHVFEQLPMGIGVDVYY
jgi:N-acetylmuramoyl-L-alanine amidase